MNVTRVRLIVTGGSSYCHRRLSRQRRRSDGVRMVVPQVFSNEGVIYTVELFEFFAPVEVRWLGLASWEP